MSDVKLSNEIEERLQAIRINYPITGFLADIGEVRTLIADALDAERQLLARRLDWPSYTAEVAMIIRNRIGRERVTTTPSADQRPLREIIDAEADKGEL